LRLRRHSTFRNDLSALAEDCAFGFIVNQAMGIRSGTSRYCQFHPLRSSIYLVGSSTEGAH
jgi:hypothetical protein